VKLQWQSRTYGDDAVEIEFMPKHVHRVSQQDETNTNNAIHMMQNLTWSLSLSYKVLRDQLP
jgi:hypothetical protein